MATLAIIKECLLALNDRSGSSLHAMNKWIESEKKVVIKKHVMKAALKTGVENGTLVPVKASYKLSPAAKKPAPKTKPAPKKKTAVTKKKPVKKTASKKKTVAKKKTTPKKKTAPKKKVALKKQ
mmetsp:Transcript_20745/g.25708  ORF Transcript_20745/g.25708 Transcript_20745/m.25708 type:complete len:124 (+) Transcript_20745:63-434(+)